MDNKRISELFFMLNEEFQKNPINNSRIAEVEYWLGQEFAKPAPTEAKSSFWSYFKLPSDWKIYATAAIGAFIAINAQLHLVPSNVQDSLLVVAGAFGLWHIQSSQVAHYENIKQLQIVHYENIKEHLAAFSQRVGIQRFGLPK
jgi:hypothetical protein